MRTSSRLRNFGTVAPRAPRRISRPWLGLAAAIIALAWPVCAGAQATFVKLPTATAVPLGVAPGADGNIWVTEHVGDKIAQITPSGTVTEFKVPTGGGGPYGITPGPDGNLWFTELTAGQIGRITTAGAITDFRSRAVTALGRSPRVPTVVCGLASRTTTWSGGSPPPG